MENKSIWQMDYKESFKQLKGKNSSSVVIVGGGITGVLNAFMLYKKGVNNISIVEAGQMLSKVTSNTTAKITSQHNLIYNEMINDIGIEKAKLYADANQWAIEEYSKIISEYSIDCDFQRKNSYVYVTNPNQVKNIEQEIKAAASLDLPVSYDLCDHLPFHIKAGICFENQAEFHPIKFLHFILNELVQQGISIYENSPVNKIEYNTVFTDAGQLSYENLILATHFPICDLKGFYFAKMHQKRAYVLALKKANHISGMYIDYDEKGYSFRNAIYQGEEVLLFGGCSHNTGHEGHIEHYKILSEKAKSLYPNCEIVSQWSAQDCMTFDKIPYIGSYSSHTTNIFVATGFNKWGMSSSMISADIISKQIIYGKSEYDDVFSPQRKDVLAQIDGFIAQTGDTIVNFTKGLINGMPKCSHLGCTVSWNEDEQTYDCPCHGSRYTKDGVVISSPTVKNLKINNS